MNKKEIAKALEGSNKLFNSVHVQYETSNPNAKTEPVSEAELADALYFLQEDYINSSPLTYEQKKILSSSKVGEVKLEDIRFMEDFSFLIDEPDDDNPFENQK